MHQIYALIGFLALIGSMFSNAILGSQIALLGVGFILLGVLSILGKIHKELKQQNQPAPQN